MSLAIGAGNYGSYGGVARSNPSSPPAAGNSKLFAAKDTASLRSLAQSQTDQFISNGRQIAQGAAGKSKISIRA